MKLYRISAIIAILAFAWIPASCVTTTTGTASQSTPSEEGSEIVERAEEFLGTPYKFGGSDPEGFDCSGLTMYVYGQSGYELPRSASDQYTNMIPVEVPRPGDLLFFVTEGNRVSHVGIYQGNYKFIHAPSTGKTVSIADIRIPYWRARYAGSRTLF